MTLQSGLLIKRTEKHDIIPETVEFKKQFRFLIICFFWLFLIVPLSRSTGIFYSLVVKGNYIMIILLPIWVYNTLFKKESFFLPISVMRLLKIVTIFILLFLILMVLQLVFNPQNSEFIELRRLLAAVLPSVSLVLLTAFYTIGSQKRQLRLVQMLFMLLILIALFSGMGIGMDTKEDIQSLERVGGIVEQANIYGFYLTLLFILSVAALTGYLKIISKKIIYIPIVIFTIILILRSGSYASFILPLLCSIPLVIKTTSVKNILGMFLTLSALVIALWSGVNIASSGELNYKAKAFLNSLSEMSVAPAYESSTFLLRYEIIVDGIQRVLEKPFLGHGYDDRSAYSTSRRGNIAVHNAFIVESLKAGIFAGLVMLLLYWRITIHSFKIKQRNSRRVVYSLLLFVFISDNTLTGFSFLTLQSGVIAFSLLLMFLVNDLSLKSGYNAPSRVY